MNPMNDPMPASTQESASQSLSSGDSSLPESPSRRELIERFGKFAVVAPPLLLFVSRAAGQEVDPEIHSIP